MSPAIPGAVEGSGPAMITVQLNQTSTETVTVDYASSDGSAIDGSDYLAVSGTLTFAPGQLSKSFSLPVLDDDIIEPDETVVITLSNPVNATVGPPAELTIIDDSSSSPGFVYQVIGETIKITDYTGPGGMVDIPSSIDGKAVTVIGWQVFADQPNITRINVPAGVTHIGYQAFTNSGGLHGSLNLAAATWIGGYAFLNCEDVTEVTIGTGITSIEPGAFKKCRSLASVNLSEGVTAIGGGAFHSCSSLTAINIPSTVGSIGVDAFMGCRALTGITLPAGLTSLGSGAFYGCAALAGITIPGGITTLDDHLFYECTSLTSVVLGGDVTSIGNTAFYGCANLAAITMPEGVTSIGDGAFSHCTSLGGVTIPVGVASIGSGAFYRCVGLTDISIPPNVITLGSSAFEGCDSLASVSLAEGIASLDYRAFAECMNLSEIDIPDSVVSLGNEVFYSCTSLTLVTVGDGVTTIGAGAFWGCSALTAVTIGGNVGSIGAYAFEYCSDLDAISIPASVESIGARAFAGCVALAGVTIGDGVSSIGSGAFAECMILEGVYFAGDAPDAPADVFSSSPVTVYYLPGTSGWGALFGGRPTALFPFAYTINPDGTARVTKYTGQAGTALDIPESIAGKTVSTIGSQAFLGSALASIVIPAGVSLIEDLAFAGCRGLISVYFEGSAPAVGADVFAGCDDVTVYYRTGTWGATFAGRPTAPFPFIYSIAGDMVTITSYTGTAALLAIPGWIDGLPVVSIDSCRSSSLTGIRIPDSVTFIGDGAFQESTTLEEIVFAGDAPSVGTEIFNGCYNATVYYLSGSTGFTSPTWEGRPTFEIDEAVYPAAIWLLTNNLPYDTDLHQDLNGDGVDLLMAYALDPDPDRNLAGSLPQAQLGPDTLGITFYGVAPGITYTVGVSTDTKTWTSISVSDPDAEGYRTATGGRSFRNQSIPRQFLRLWVIPE